MTDQDVLNYCYIDSKNKIHDNIVKNKIPNMSIKMIQYLNNKFNDSESINESINRIKYNIIIRPTCKYCGKHVKYLRKNLYQDFCTCSCKQKYWINQFEEKTGLRSSLLLPNIKEKTQQTLLNKYGVDNVSKSSIIKEKKKQSFINHYGYENNFCNELILNKAIDNSHLLESNIKRKNTCINKYGKETFLETNKGKSLSNSHKLKISKAVKSKEFQEKRFNTLSKNNTWNKSKIEELVYSELLKYFNSNDIIRQYKSKLYPFYCDFYIQSKDIYIEVQGSQFHHFKPFESTNEDLIELQKLIDLSKNHKQYLAIINTWTKYDVIKRNIARKNKLNYIEIFPKDNYELIIKNIL